MPSARDQREREAIAKIAHSYRTKIDTTLNQEQAKRKVAQAILKQRKE